MARTSTSFRFCELRGGGNETLNRVDASRTMRGKKEIRELFISSLE